MGRVEPNQDEPTEATRSSTATPPHQQHLQEFPMIPEPPPASSFDEDEKGQGASFDNEHQDEKDPVLEKLEKEQAKRGDTLASEKEATLTSPSMTLTNPTSSNSGPTMTMAPGGAMMMGSIDLMPMPLPAETEEEAMLHPRVHRSRNNGSANRNQRPGAYNYNASVVSMERNPSLQKRGMMNLLGRESATGEDPMPVGSIRFNNEPTVQSDRAVPPMPMPMRPDSSDDDVEAQQQQSQQTTSQDEESHEPPVRFIHAHCQPSPQRGASKRMDSSGSDKNAKKNAKERASSSVDSSSKYIKLGLIGIACLVVIVVGVVVGLVAGLGNKDDTSSESEEPILQIPLLQQLFEDPREMLPAETIVSIQFGNEKDAPVKAFRWLAADENWFRYSVAQRRQRLALATIYFATDGPHWFDRVDISDYPYSMWINYRTHECEWFSLAELRDYQVCHNYTKHNVPWEEPFVDYKSVVLSGSPHFTANTDITNPVLRGSLPLEVSMLTKLQRLDVSTQRLTGVIPSQLSKLSNSLQNVILHSCYFSGTIPSRLYEFPVQLWVSNNTRLSHDGTLPAASLARNTNLELLSLVGANLQGHIPKELFTSATNLKQLLLSDNSLTGSIPTEVALATGLRDWRMARNELGGRLPTELGLMSNLGAIRMSSNYFRGPIPSQIGSLSRAALRWIDLSKNKLSGVIPSQVGLLTKLTSLNAQENDLSGGLPDSLSRLSDLMVLELSFNDLVGSLPPTLLVRPSNDGGAANWPRLQTLGLRGNRFNGTIPTQIGLSTEMWRLWLSVNDFDGTIPSELGLLTQLQSVMLENNQLSGEVPTELSLLANLTWLNLAGNSDLKGTVPQELCTRRPELTLNLPQQVECVGVR